MVVLAIEDSFARVCGGTMSLRALMRSKSVSSGCVLVMSRSEESEISESERVRC